MTNLENARLHDSTRTLVSLSKFRWLSQKSCHKLLDLALRLKMDIHLGSSLKALNARALAHEATL